MISNPYRRTDMREAFDLGVTRYRSAGLHAIFRDYPRDELSGQTPSAYFKGVSAAMFDREVAA